MTKLTVGIDIGGTKIAVGLVTAAGDIIARVEAPTPAKEGAERILEVAIQLARELMTGHEVIAVGVGSAGVIDSVTRRVLSATDALSGWAGTDIGGVLEDALRVPVITVNDVHAHAVGEAFAGAGRHYRTVIMAAIGTGVGGAIVVDGVPLAGAHGAGGHLGHVVTAEAAGLPCTCGKTGHLEAISSGPALYDLYRRLGGDSSVRTGREVAARITEDPIARDAIVRSAVALGYALGGLVNVIDPDIVIISGGMRNAGELWWTSMETAIRATTIPILNDVSVIPALLGDDAAIIGAGKLAWDFLAGQS